MKAVELFYISLRNSLALVGEATEQAAQRELQC